MTSCATESDGKKEAMTKPIESLQALLGVLNAALEHVPANTRQILTAAAQPQVQALEKALNPPQGEAAERSSARAPE